nr:hypothetical protein HmN_000902500 [Hymenolepis microstoma]
MTASNKSATYFWSPSGLLDDEESKRNGGDEYGISRLCGRKKTVEEETLKAIVELGCMLLLGVEVAVNCFLGSQIQDLIGIWPQVFLLPAKINCDRFLNSEKPRRVEIDSKIRHNERPMVYYFIYFYHFFFASLINHSFSFYFCIH